jgi:2-oxoisovalerate dehydrogenase E1 component beta subunit
VVTPSRPVDAKGLLIAALEAEDPILFLEPKRFYSQDREPVPVETYRIPIGTARVVRDGVHATMVTYGPMVSVALTAADILMATGISCEVIDLRSLNPVDEPLVFESIMRTRRAAVLHEAPKTCGFGAELSARITEEMFDTLRAPVMRIGGFDTPYPFALEHLYDLSPERVAHMIQRLCSENGNSDGK